MATLLAWPRIVPPPAAPFPVKIELDSTTLASFSESIAYPDEFVMRRSVNLRMLLLLD